MRFQHYVNPLLKDQTILTVVVQFQNSKNKKKNEEQAFLDNWGILERYINNFVVQYNFKFAPQNYEGQNLELNPFFMNQRNVIIE